MIFFHLADAKLSFRHELTWAKSHRQSRKPNDSVLTSNKVLVWAWGLLPGS